MDDLGLLTPLIKTLKPLGVTAAVGLDVDGESYRYYVIGLTDGKGKTTARRVLIKELSAMDACNTISDSWENVVTSVRLLDVVNVIR